MIFVSLMEASGLRVGEMMAVRHCDCEIFYDKRENLNYLKINNILGKRGRTGVCKAFYGSYLPFKRILKRHGLTEENYLHSQEALFQKFHRDMFRDLLKSIGLYETNDRPPRRRSLASLRNTYICFRLLNGVPVYDVAKNCRTSVVMIENHYTQKHLNIKDSPTINRVDFSKDMDE